jgi:hypothetical protein
LLIATERRNHPGSMTGALGLLGLRGGERCDATDVTGRSEELHFVCEVLDAAWSGKEVARYCLSPR